MTPMHNLGVREAASMVTAFLLGKAFLRTPVVFAEDGGTAAWLVALIAVLIAACGWLVIRSLLRRHPGENLMEATETALGPVFGTLVNLAYFLFLFLTALTLVRDFADSLVTVILPRTPVSVLIGIFLIVGTYAAYLGVEAISRIAWLFGALVLIGLVFIVIFGLITHAEPDGIFPFWGYGPAQTVGMGIVRSSMLGKLVLMGVVATQFRSARDVERTALWALAAGGGLLVLLTLVYQLVFPYPAAAKISFPLLQMARVILVGRWVQRVEAVFLFAWVIVAVLALATGIFATSRVLAATCKLADYRLLLIPLLILAYSTAHIPPSVYHMEVLGTDVLHTFGGLIAFGLPLLTLLVSLLRRKGGASGAASN